MLKGLASCARLMKHGREDVGKQGMPSRLNARETGASDMGEMRRILQGQKQQGVSPGEQLGKRISGRLLNE